MIHGPTSTEYLGRQPSVLIACDTLSGHCPRSNAQIVLYPSPQLDLYGRGVISTVQRYRSRCYYAHRRKFGTCKNILKWVTDTNRRGHATTNVIEDTSPTFIDVNLSKRKI